MKLISKMLLFLFFISISSSYAEEAKFYKIDGKREDGRVCTLEISFGNNQHSDSPFIAYYGDVLSYIPLDVSEIAELHDVNNGLKEIMFQGEHVWSYSKIRLIFDNQKRLKKVSAKLRPYLSPFWDRDECYFNVPRIDF